MKRFISKLKPVPLGDQGQMEMATLGVAMASLTVVAMASMWLNDSINKAGTDKSTSEQQLLISSVSNAASLQDFCKAGFNDATVNPLAANNFFIPTSLNANSVVDFKFAVKIGDVQIQETLPLGSYLVNVLKLHLQNGAASAPLPKTVAAYSSGGFPINFNFSLDLQATRAGGIPVATMLPLVATFKESPVGSGKMIVNSCAVATGLGGGATVDNVTIQNTAAANAAEIATQTVCQQLNYTWDVGNKKCNPAASTAFCKMFAQATYQASGSNCRLPAALISGAGGGTANIINVNYGTGKTGAAAIGVAGDTWNDAFVGWSPDFTISNLKTSKNISTSVSLRSQNGGGFYGGNANPPWNVTDAMFLGYMYPVNNHGGNLTLTLSGLAAGTYSFYLFGHGAANTANNTFYVTAGGVQSPSRSTSNQAGWEVMPFVDGKQYVLISNVLVMAGQTAVITSVPGGYDSQINGFQITW